MKKVRRSFSLSSVAMVAVMLLVSACHPGNPPMTGVAKPAAPVAVAKVGPMSFETSFGFFKSEATAEQQKHNENTITVHFQTKKPDGNPVEDLKADDVTVTENGVTVTPFSLDSDRKESQQLVDIVLLVDITGTMVDLIDEAKARLQDFVTSEEAKKLNIRICVATFGDYTVKNCRRFYNINKKEAGDAQRKEFISELARLQAFRGQGRDPGYPDLDENPMGALIDAAKAPWGTNSQRFVILMTDWGFLYSPDNQGTIGSRAPTMKQVNDAIREAKMKVFAITRTQHDFKSKSNKLEKNCTWTDAAQRLQHCTWNGFNSSFQDEPGIVQASGGQHFDFDRVRDTKREDHIKFSKILNDIIIQVNITYTLSYVVENVQGLDPSLPIDKRDIQISLRDSSRGTVTMSSPLSSVPTGRPLYKQAFTVSENPILPGSATVTMNGQPVSPNEFTVNGGKIRFKSVPPPGAKMTFSFFYENSELNLKLEPISMHGSLTARNTKVYLNDLEARAEDVIFGKDISGHTSIGFNNSIMASNDPYNIRRNQSLKVKISSSAE